MKAMHILLSWLVLFFSAAALQAQSTSDSTGKPKEKKFQATAPPTRPFGKEALDHPKAQPSDG